MKTLPPGQRRVAKAILTILPGFLFETALLGADAVTDVPDAVRVLLPN